MKARILGILALFSVALGAAAENYNAIWFCSAPNYTDIYFMAKNKPVWQPTREKHIITYNGQEYHFPNNTSTQLGFRYVDTSSLPDVEAGKPQIIVSDESVCISTGESRCTVSITSINGVVYAEKTVPANTREVFATSKLPAGNYVIKFNDSTLKFLKR